MKKRAIVKTFFSNHLVGKNPIVQAIKVTWKGHFKLKGVQIWLRDNKRNYPKVCY